jgi:hypothetical protein
MRMYEGDAGRRSPTISPRRRKEYQSMKSLERLKKLLKSIQASSTLLVT